MIHTEAHFIRWAGGLGLCLSLIGGAAGPGLAYDDISLSGRAAFKDTVGSPAGIAVLPSGDWIVSDEKSGNLRVFSKEGKAQGTWGKKGKGPEGLERPQGLDADVRGNVFVADAGLHRVAVFSPSGKFLRTLGEHGSGPGQLLDPSDVAVSHDGVVFVADTGNNRVQVFSADGVFILGFGAPGDGDGQFKKPSAIALTPKGRVFVMDHKRVQVFSSEGAFLGALERPKAEPKQKEPPAPTGLAADAYGYVYVAGDHQKIEEYDPDGSYVSSFGTFGSGAGQFRRISALAAGPKALVVALDGKLQRAQGFTLVSKGHVEPQYPSPTFRFSVQALRRFPFEADAVAVSGGRAVGLNAKTARLVFQNIAGAGDVSAPEADASSPSPMKSPLGLFIRDRKVFVADTGNRRVTVWDLAGRPTGDAPIGSGGRREGQFKFPRSVAVDAGGRLVVADSGLGRVQMFSTDGIFFRSLPGAFKDPVGVAPVSGGAAVLDAGTRQLLYFDDKGQAAGKPVGGFLSPLAVAADPGGRSPFVYVLDGGDGQVKAVSGGKIVARFGSPSLLAGAKTLAVDEEGVLWVGDGTTLKSFRLRMAPLAPKSLAAAPGEGQVVLTWTPDPEKLAEGFRLYRGRASDVSGAPYRVFAATETTFLDREIIPGSTYYYTLSAVTGGSDALEGARVNAQTFTVRPANLPPVDIADLTLDRIFSAQYKFYKQNPVGRLSVKNNSEKTFQKVRVGFILKDYMDYVTETVIDRLEPGALVPVDLKATFNNKILSVTEDTPIQAQVTVTYYDDGEEKVFSRAEPVPLYARNAMSWEDPRRLATFVTTRDPAVLDFGRGAVRVFQKELAGRPLNVSLAKAAVIFEAVRAQGISYQKDPESAIADASKKAKAVDYVQFPRETLSRKAGDCDDLTVLMAALLEGASVDTAFITVPGHVLLAFRPDLSGGINPGLPSDRVLSIDGEAWIPVETTALEKPFLEAWKRGAKQVRNVPEDQVGLVETQDAWEAYAPATLKEEKGPRPPKKEDLLPQVKEDFQALEDDRLAVLTARYEARLKKNPEDVDARLQLGIVRAEHGRFNESASDFDALLIKSPDDAAALNNRGNLHWLAGRPEAALKLYQRASEADPKDAGILINLARAAEKTGDAALAKASFKSALLLDPSLKMEYSSLEEVAK